MKFFGEFCPEDTQEAQEVHQRGHVGPTRHQGTLGPPGVPWWVVPPSGHPLGAALAHWWFSGP